jgi:hypothetical protein
MKDRTTCKQICVAAIVLITFVLAVESQANGTSSRKGDPAAASAKILHFPQDQSVGVVYLQDETVVIPETVKGFHSGYTYVELENFSCAQGQVHIPAGKRVILCIRGIGVTPERYRTSLESLGPNDLYGLQFFTINPVHIGDDLIVPITRLTGLRKLGLSSVGVSPGGLALLAELPQIEELSTPVGLSDKGMAEIAKMQSMKRLHVARDTLTDAGLGSIGKLASLEVLDLYGNPRMTDDGLRALRDLRFLRHLRLGREGSFTDRGMEHVASLPSLKVLWLDTPNVTDEGLRWLARSRSLERLYVYWLDTITDRGIVYLKDMPRLRKLNVGHARLTDAGLANFAAIEYLDYLCLPGGFTDTGISHLANINHLKHLRVNCYSNSPLTDNALATAGKMHELRELHISGTGFTSEGIELLRKLDNLQVLNMLTFGSDGLDNKNLKQLAGLSKLRDLWLGPSNNITISGLNTLNALSDLENLSVCDVHQDDRGLDISGLKKLRRLNIGMWSKTTRLGNEFVTTCDAFRDSDLACLSGLTEIENLGLTGPGLGDDGFKHLAWLTKLKHLQITGSTDLTDDGLLHLANMRRLDSLTIHNSRITERGLAHLYPLKTLHIILIHSVVPIGSSAIARLRTELPHLQAINISQPKSTSQEQGPKQTFRPQIRQSLRQRGHSLVNPSRANQRTSGDRQGRR